MWTPRSPRMLQRTEEVFRKPKWTLTQKKVRNRILRIPSHDCDFVIANWFLNQFAITKWTELKHAQRAGIPNCYFGYLLLVQVTFTFHFDWIRFSGISGTFLEMFSNHIKAYLGTFQRIRKLKCGIPLKILYWKGTHHYNHMSIQLHLFFIDANTFILVLRFSNSCG